MMSSLVKKLRDQRRNDKRHRMKVTKLLSLQAADFTRKKKTNKRSLFGFTSCKQQFSNKLIVFKEKSS